MSKSEYQEALQKAMREIKGLRRFPWTIWQMEHIRRAIKELEAILEE